MRDEEINNFKEIVRDLLRVEVKEEAGQPNRCELPRTLFTSAVRSYRKGKSISTGEIYLLARVFLSVLDEDGIVIEKKDRKYFLGGSPDEKKKGGGSQLSLSYDVMAGARAAQVRHDGVLKYDQ